MVNNKKAQNHRFFIHVLLIIGVIFTLIPFLWMLSTSLKTVSESVQVPPVMIPKDWQWSNYKDVLTLLPFSKFYFNTLVSTAAKTFGQLLFCSMAAYAFARIEFPFRNTIFIVFLSILMVPSQIFLLPHYLIMQHLHLLNTVRALILPGLFSAFGTFLMRQFFMGIPQELEESAVLDGCNHFQIYWHIMLPLSKSALTALGVITVLWSWNDLMWPLIVNNSTDKMTLSAGIATMQGEFFTEFHILMAGSVLAILPMIILFVIFQNMFIEGIAFTGHK
jgi:multiple sugar transport system permease protein